MAEDTTRSPSRETLRATRRQLEELKYALDQAAIVAVTDRRGTIRYVNHKFCKISGYREEELLGQDHRIVNSGHHPKSFFQDMWRTIGQGRVWRGEIRNRAKDGSIYWVDTTVVPFLDEDGKPERYLAIRYEITRRKQAEERLRKAEALARLGQMAAVLAHEVRNPLAGISGALEIIRERLAENRDREVIDNMQARIDELNRRLQDLLIYSRPRVPHPTPIDVRGFLDSLTGLWGNDPATAGVRVRVRGETGVIRADPELLRDVFLNLLINAAQAMDGHGRIEVEVAMGEGRCRVSVRDSGSGIVPADRERIFEPFFTTKSRGTGLGLSIAQQVVEAHRGTIAAEHPSGGGTVVTVTLPAGSATEASAIEETPGQTGSG